MRTLKTYLYSEIMYSFLKGSSSLNAKRENFKERQNTSAIVRIKENLCCRKANFGDSRLEFSG